MQKAFPNLKTYLINGGSLETSDTGSVMLRLPTKCDGYCDAQLDDYHDLPRRKFLWNPPCYLEIRVRASHPDPPGTLGFGFWNDPFTLSLGQGGAARRFPAAPQTLWYFYGSKENNIQLNPGLPGFGWKASGIRSPRISPFLLPPIAALAMVISHIPRLRNVMMNLANRIVIAEETFVDVAMDQWHTYRLDWYADEAIFYVDSQEIHLVRNPPVGPLGFVLWIDNQFAVASPDDHFHFGVIQTLDSQWLEIESLVLSAH